MRAPVGTLHPSSTVLSLALEAPSALDTSGITSSAGQAARVSALAVAAMDWRAFSCKSRGRGGEGARGGGCELGGRRAPLELVAKVAGQAEKGHSTVVPRRALASATARPAHLGGSQLALGGHKHVPARKQSRVQCALGVSECSAQHLMQCSTSPVRGHPQRRHASRHPPSRALTTARPRCRAGWSGCRYRWQR